MAIKSFLENTIGPAYARLASRPSFYPFNKALFHLSLRGMGLFNLTSASSGERYFIRKTLPGLLSSEAPTLFDIGANVGHYTAFLHESFPNASIHAFEPHPKNYAVLTSTHETKATFHNMAMGSSDGAITLYDRADQDGSTHASVYKDVITEWHHQKEIRHEVPVQTLDTFTKQHGIEYIDFMKIDTEGHEYDVLLGAGNLLSKQRIGVIQFEFGCLHSYSHHFLNDFKQLLPEYQFYRLLPHSLLPLDKPPVEIELFGHQNVVALAKNHI